VAAGVLAELRSRRTPVALIPDEPQGFKPHARRLTRQAIQYFLVPVWSLAASPIVVSPAQPDRAERRHHLRPGFIC
jgi:hypothetical protein